MDARRGGKGCRRGRKRGSRRRLCGVGGCRGEPEVASEACISATRGPRISQAWEDEEEEVNEPSAASKRCRESAACSAVVPAPPPAPPGTPWHDAEAKSSWSPKCWQSSCQSRRTNDSSYCSKGSIGFRVKEGKWGKRRTCSTGSPPADRSLRYSAPAAAPAAEPALHPSSRSRDPGLISAASSSPGPASPYHPVLGRSAASPPHKADPTSRASRPP